MSGEGNLERRGSLGISVSAFDATNSFTLEAAAEWKQDLDRKVRVDSGRLVPSVLLANKRDLKGGGRGHLSWLNTCCEENGSRCRLETSAKVCS